MEKGLHLFGKNAVERVENALWQLKRNRGVIIVDDEDRENEGDLIFQASSMTAEDMAFLIRESSGIVCVCLLEERATHFALSYMVPENTSRFQTPFTVSVDARDGITTGVSAKDRITTIQVLCKHGQPEELSRPGHIFPLIAKNEGVLVRNGHTEASVDLMRLAKLQPIAVLCELMNPDGSMRRLPDVIDFALNWQLTVVSIEDIIYYRTFVRDFLPDYETAAASLH